MIYSDFKGKKISRLGFGTMRLPVNENGDINEEETRKMIKYSFDHGINYFDTAYPYHKGMSEIVVGKILSEYPRESFYLADKFPGHQISDSYDPEGIFKEQLEKCKVEYFDFYLLHNIYENSVKTYFDERWGIIEYFIKMKREGKIKHLGFSSHGGLDILKRVLDKYSSEIDFVQIQFNYLDYSLQNAKEKYDLISSYNIPVWVMEPVRGGTLAKLPSDKAELLKERRPGESLASWAFRWLLNFDNTKVILSGMSNMDQMVDNIKTFDDPAPLSEEETNILSSIALSLYERIPCTSCRYCTDNCPMGLDIPMLISICNDLKFAKVINASMRIEALDPEKRPSACLACGACASVCPQKIDIPSVLKELSSIYSNMPKWKDVSAERAKEAQDARKYID